MLNDPVLVNDWHAVARSADLQDGQVLAARLLEEDLVLWRAGGEVMAWRDLCIHRGTRLSLGWVDDHKLVCPYHGWTYNTAGRCVHIPAHPEQTPPTKARAEAYRVQERYGLVWVCPGTPARDLPTFGEWDDDAFRKIPVGPYTMQASAPRAIENFVDVAHFPILHPGLLGDPGRAEIEDYHVEIGEDGIATSDIQIYQPNPDGTGEGKVTSYVYHIYRPFTLTFRKSSAGPHFSMFYTATPVETGKTVGWGIIAMNYAAEMPEEEIRAFEDHVFAQDVPIVESQRPELLPLDLQAELHLRSDRLAIAYRRWLNELGLKFGTA